MVTNYYSLNNFLTLRSRTLRILGLDLKSFESFVNIVVHCYFNYRNLIPVSLFKTTFFYPAR
jgi:hypothetical protein